MSWWREASTHVGHVAPGLDAAAAGIKSGDAVIDINGANVDELCDLSLACAMLAVNPLMAGNRKSPIELVASIVEQSDGHPQIGPLILWVRRALPSTVGVSAGPTGMVISLIEASVLIFAVSVQLPMLGIRLRCP